ncbi:MAG: ATP synthase F1 subunit gamma [Cytophagales bacterium]|nr:ATP synthase F1 subunit gamma [Bernardetiaceae bacterium]MDW8210697.1 ATP synthase F1 subunit gamma [Cytophagales bacterium]
MPSLKEVRNRINSVRSTQQITKAMKMVAAAKLRRAQDAIIQMRPYSRQLQEVLSHIMESAYAEEELIGPFFETRPVERVLIVCITSDRGLCGSFNSNVIKACNTLINEKYAKQHRAGRVALMPIGKKGRDFFKRKNVPLIEDFTELFAKLSFDKVRPAAEFVMNQFANKKYDVVELVYNEFKNVATQIVRVVPYLPLQLPAEETKEKRAIVADFIYEPDKTSIIAELLPKTLKIQFYKTLLESNAAEHGARMTAMDKATENAGELLKQLRLIYNRTRQDAITKEILEIVGGAEALTKG